MSRTRRLRLGRSIRTDRRGVRLRHGRFDLHRLAVEDAIKAHQRPKVERYGDTVFVVLRTVRYLKTSRTLEFGEIHAFVGTSFVVTVRHGEASSLRGVRRAMEEAPGLLRRGPEAVLYMVMDHIVDDYASVIDSLENDIDEVETEVFGGNPSVSRRIYEVRETRTTWCGLTSLDSDLPG